MEQKGILKFIRENWVAIVFIAGLIGTWTKFTVNQTDFEKRLTKNEAAIEAVNPVLLALQTSMARVETTLEFIKQRLNETK
jgi:hypothetical protein